MSTSCLTVLFVCDYCEIITALLCQIAKDCTLRTALGLSFFLQIANLLVSYITFIIAINLLNLYYTIMREMWSVDSYQIIKILIIRCENFKVKILKIQIESNCCLYWLNTGQLILRKLIKFLPPDVIF